MRDKLNAIPQKKIMITKPRGKFYAKLCIWFYDKNEALREKLGKLTHSFHIN